MSEENTKTTSAAKTEDLFIRASRIKLRIPTARGSISVEDLWDLDLTSNRAQTVTLDSIAVDLNHLIAKNEGEPTSFVNPSGPCRSLELTKLQFAIVKYIIDVRLAEKAASEEENKRRLAKRRLQEALANREQRDIDDMSADEIRAELEKLN